MDGQKIRRAAIHNLGCKVNAYEADAVGGLLREAGYALVDFEEEAEVYIINTCSVTAIADKKSRQMIRRARQRSADACIVAMGCFINTADAGELAALPVDIALGNHDKTKLPGLLDAFFAKPGRLCVSSEITKGRVTYEPMHLPDQLQHTRAFLKVQDGCDQFCSYCIIPYARGRACSAPVQQVLSEVRMLAANGYKEVDLSGIYLSGYGTDIGTNLLELLSQIQEVDGIERIRLGSLEQGVMTEAFVREIAGMSKLCPHFHLSLQSGSDTVLQRMNRRYDTARYRESCARLRAYYENPAITTDVIAGFPGETEAEYAETCAFVQEIGFYQMHVFPYSKRAGTKAAEMDGQISLACKKERTNHLIALSGEMSRAFEAAFRGKEVRVLYEECRNGVYGGYTEEYVRIQRKYDENMIGHIRTEIF